MGYLRFSLIIAVVYYHLGGKITAGPVAVHGFFLLSGYVITLVAAEIYNNGWRGKAWFLANRAARVYPTYIVCLLISLLCMYATGFSTHLYQREFTLPVSPEGWLVQLSIVGQSGFTGERYLQRILPPAWSLSTEVVYYFIIGLITGQSKLATTIAFALSTALSGYMLYHEVPWQYFYFSIYGPAIIFFTGAMFYHYRHLFQKVRLRNMWLLVGLGNVILYTPDLLGIPTQYIPVQYVTTFYLGYIIMCLHLASLERKPSKLDQFLADITYPMFLLHWPMGAIVCYYGFELYQRNATVFVPSLILTTYISAMIVLAVEMPGKKLRRHFREKASRRQVIEAAGGPP